MTPRFSDLVVPATPRRTIILDIDGTLVADGEIELSPDTIAALGALAGAHDVYLCSNNVDPERSRAIAETSGLPLLMSRYRKPDARVISDLKVRHPILVIGDKYLTDEVFARRLKADFIRVERIVSHEDALLTRLTYVFDDAVFALAKAMNRFV